MKPDTSYYMSRRESELRTAFLEQVSVIPDGERIKQCIQCGTCTGSCPVSYAMDITPRKVMALFRAGEIETVLRSNTIWICASCYACTVRCPAGIKITDTMYAFKRTAMDKKLYPEHFDVRALSRSFMDIVNATGRNHEMKLLMRFGLRSNPFRLLRNLPMGLRLRLRGRLPITGKTIKGRKALSGIIQQALRRTRAGTAST